MQRDQIRQPIFPYEGTRKTIDPLTNTLLEGTGETSAAGLEPTYDYFFEDRITGDIYEVHVTPIAINDVGGIVYFTTSEITLAITDPGEEIVYQGMTVNNGWDIYVRNGEIATEKRGKNNIGIVNGICDFGAIPENCTIDMLDFASVNVYSVNFDEDPIVPVLNASPTGLVFNGVQVGNGFFVVLNGVLQAYSSPPAGPIYFNECIQIDEQIGGPIPEVPGEPPPVIEVPTDLELLVDERWEVFLPDLPTIVDERWEVLLPDLPDMDVSERWES